MPQLTEVASKVEIIEEPSALKRFAADWNRLAEPFETPLLRHEWFVACAEAFCPPHRLHTVVVRTDGEVTGIAPLMRVNLGGIDTLQLLGSLRLYEPGGLLYRDAASLHELLAGTLASGEPVLLRRIPADSPVISLLREHGGERRVLVIRSSPGSPWLPLPADWAAFESQMSSRCRTRLRRARRQAEAMGRVRFETVRPPAAEVGFHLEEVQRIEAAGWKGRRRTALRFDERLNSFFHAYSRASAHLGALRLSFLRIDGVPAAFQLAVEHASRFWILKIGYDERFARCSPGILLTHESIRAAAERGLAAYEFLGTDESWIHIWTHRIRRYVSVRIYPLSWRAGLRLMADASRFVVDKLIVAKA